MKLTYSSVKNISKRDKINKSQKGQTFSKIDRIILSKLLTSTNSFEKTY
ncbi:hypothetical protein SMIDD26_00679 [Streptococcus mitis]|uniref:Uncharacterized protein n=1 Tax=Streptococcus mitis TaxID=28037 RepID=A0A139PUC4_STRMT|nr:hypothetical protein SMIDD26_00679 [Streptococcus mitis]